MYYDLIESGKRIRELREEKGYTQEKFADAIGMSQKTIASIENGKKGTKIDTLVAMAEVLDSSLDYIVSGMITNQKLSEMLNQIEAEKQDMALRILKGILENL